MPGTGNMLVFELDCKSSVMTRFWRWRVLNTRLTEWHRRQRRVAIQGQYIPQVPRGGTGATTSQRAWLAKGGHAKEVDGPGVSGARENMNGSRVETNGSKLGLGMMRPIER